MSKHLLQKMLDWNTNNMGDDIIHRNMCPLIFYPTCGKYAELHSRDVRQGFPCSCSNHQISLCATGACLTAVWTLKRGDNLISTHVNTAAGGQEKTVGPLCICHVILHFLAPRMKNI